MSTKEDRRARFRDLAPLLVFSGGCLVAATDSSFDTTHRPSVAAWCALGLLLAWLDVEFAVGVRRQPPTPPLPPAWAYYALTVVGCLPALYAVLFDHDKLTLGWWAMAVGPIGGAAWKAFVPAILVASMLHRRGAGWIRRDLRPAALAGLGLIVASALTVPIGTLLIGAVSSDFRFALALSLTVAVIINEAFRRFVRRSPALSTGTPERRSPPTP